ncbi:UNVERIFIED_CONTAM: hypothetical protein Sangu_1657100 [Sesamum angustifolium]|uniref:Uncharacterized protein n=1 Tax=Sesamum angustifolium TaxID=2727405 RepID=A0AAW2MKM8_9LAMI
MERFLIEERKRGLVLWQGTIGGIVLVGCPCVWLRLQTAPWLKLLRLEKLFCLQSTEAGKMWFWKGTVLL